MAEKPELRGLFSFDKSQQGHSDMAFGPKAIGILLAIYPSNRFLADGRQVWSFMLLVTPLQVQICQFCKSPFDVAGTHAI